MMPLLEILFWSVVLYYLFRFVFNFLLPVARATRHVRQQFRNMQDPMGGGMGNPMGGHADQTGQYNEGSGQKTKFGQTDPYGNQRPGPTERPGQQSGQRPSGKAPAGDYIDFEEIK